MYCSRLFGESHFHTHMAHQIITRYIAKTEFFLGLLESLAEEQNVIPEPHTIQPISRTITYLETFKALRLASEIGASRTNSDISFQTKVHFWLRPFTFRSFIRT